MEPLDDSLFVRIQNDLFIDPPDPKAEIIADLRDPNNQTVSIKGTLYPFLALSPESRARIVTYPFKINLEEQIHFGSVFSRVFEKMRLSKVVDPPTLTQISPTQGYINPFVQLMGGERLGIPIKKDIGLSFGIGTPYSGALNTNFVEANFHILGASIGAFSHIDAMIEAVKENNHNNLIVTEGFQVGYVIPFGNFFQVSYTSVSTKFTNTQRRVYLSDNRKTVVYNSDGSVKYQAWLMEGSFFNWEFRYPVSLLGATRGKVYVAYYLDEWHAGLHAREMSLAGSTFDFQFDAMPKSKHRNPEYVINILVQKIAESWGFSAFAIGPSIVLSNTSKGSLGATKILLNMRFKIGTSL
jgi:hypothetical protein